eukprot:TRINITY_DN1495_c0_g2_i2.p1 TRINITY_DN1495_c0_g2~~TRINITY_DN1495_c0_g2_i2.p1  ORF type:complete len:896 (-),score=103.89 TRINITY_DN1495_c0_g2_i2:693-3179(-)
MEKQALSARLQRDLGITVDQFALEDYTKLFGTQREMSETIRKFIQHAQDTMLSVDKWFERHCATHNIDPDDPTTITPAGYAHMMEMMGGFAKLYQVQVTVQDVPHADQARVIRRGVEEATLAWLRVPYSRVDFDDTSSGSTRRRWFASLDSVLERIVYVEDGEEEETTKKHRAGLLAKYLVSRKLEAALCKELRLEMEDEPLTPTDMLKMWKKHPHITHEMMQVMHEYAPKTFPPFNQVLKARKDRYSIIDILRWQDTEGKLVARWVKLSQILEHQVAALMDHLGPQNGHVVFDVALCGDGFSIVPHFPTFTPQGVPVATTKRFHLSAMISRVTRINERGTEIIWEVEDLNSRKNATLLLLARARESRATLKKFMADWNPVIMEWERDGKVFPNVGNEPVGFEFRLNCDDVFGRLAKGLPGPSSKWYSCWTMGDSMFGRIISRAMDSIEERRYTPLAVFTGRVADWIRTRGLNMSRLADAYERTRGEYGKAFENLDEAKSWNCLMQQIEDFLVKNRHSRRVVFLIKRGSRADDFSDMEDDEDELNAPTVAEAENPGDGEFDVIRPRPQDPIIDPNGGDEEDGYNLTHENVVSALFDGAFVRSFVGKMAGQVTVPPQRTKMGNAPPPTFHIDENMSTAIRDLMATFSDRCQRLAEFTQSLVDLGLSKCTGVMQGNQIRELFLKMDDLLKKMRAWPNIEILQSICSWGRIRWLLRASGDNKMMLDELTELCYRFGVELNRNFPEAYWRNYARIVVFDIPEAIKQGVPLYFGNEDWCESVIQGVKTAKTSGGGGLPGLNHTNERELQIISRQLMVSDLGLSESTSKTFNLD